MREIIYLANARMPTEKAHGIQIIKMCEALSGGGVKVTLVLPWRFNKIKKDIFEFYGAPQNFKIKKIFSLDLVSLHIPFVSFALQSLSFALAAFFYLIFRKTDIIYSRDYLPLCFLSPFKKRLVYEIHGLPRMFLPWGFLKKIWAIVAITQNIKDRLMANGIMPEKVLVAPDGVDLVKFDISENQKGCRQKLNLPSDKKIVIYTGHLYSWKGAQTLAEAASLLDQNILTVFVGGTEDDVLTFKNKNQAIKNILVLGHHPYEEMPLFLKAADVLVLPNSASSDVSKFFTSPMKLFEYMAANRPIIASNLPSIGEILNEETAVFFEPDNAVDLADKIKLILKDQKLAEKLATNSHWLSKSYSWTNRADKIISHIFKT